MARRRHYKGKTPYWNFWKVVLAGWLIQRPGLIFKILAIPAGMILLQILKHLKS